MPESPELHTVPNPFCGGWLNEVAGAPVSWHESKSVAVRHGRRIARRRRWAHVIHRRDGTVTRTEFHPD